MSEIERSDRNERRAKRLRGAIYIAIAVQVLLWLGLFFYIGRHANPKGDGMEWVAVMPATLILAAGAGPPFAFRHENRLLPVGALIACAGVVFGIAFFLEIVREFAEAAVR